MTKASVVGLLLPGTLLLDQPTRALVQSWNNRPLDLLIELVNPIGNGVTLLVACLLLYLLMYRSRRGRLQEAAWLSAWGFVAAGLLEFTLKHLVGRPRPSVAVTTDLPLGPTFSPEFDSFPSGHATSVFAVAAAFAHFCPRLRWPLYLLATTVALGRVYLDRHYLSDVVAGALIGWLVIQILARRRSRTAPQDPPDC
ncbi:phosphatase PAP2 family protein [Nitrospira sp. Kam-Ns4a]